VKLVIQIPAFNEEQTLPTVLRGLPRTLKGIDAIEWLVIDDGSTDRTAAIALAHGADHVLTLPQRQGLARAYSKGLEESVRLGADIVVNTDADNQYSAEDIPALIAPILSGSAELAIGARPISQTAHFSLSKRFFQRLGSRVTRIVSGTLVEDAASGFRAISRSAAMRLHVYGNYTYTVETIIQAGRQGIAIASVPIRTNPETRPSRLVKGAGSYVAKQVLTMVRVFVVYKPFRFFAVPGSAIFVGGLLVALRFVYLYATGRGAGHVQSLILAALLLGIGFFLLVAGLLADLLAVNRVLLEGIDCRVKQLAYGPAKSPERSTASLTDQAD
jgi:glycosyltransferase involved in cell wall biosynthesis